MLSPSVDRIDDYRSYIFDNIQLMTWRKNLDKSYTDRKNGVNNKLSKTVLQFTLSGKFIKEYYSQSQATRNTGVNRGNLNSCCNGNVKTAGGFIWKTNNIGNNLLPLTKQGVKK